MRTYTVRFQGQDLAVEAVVEHVLGTPSRVRVRIFSVREIAWSGYEHAPANRPEHDREKKHADRARGGATHHVGGEPNEAGHVVALSGWTPERRADLTRLVERASELTDGVVDDGG